MGGPVDSTRYAKMVKQSCERQGLRLTDLRAQVLKQLIAAGRPMKAYDLVVQLSFLRSIPTAPMVVYRALHFLANHGFIQRLESINAFVPRLDPLSSRPSPYLICDKCHASVEVQDELIETRIKAIATVSGFAPRRHVLEILGVCKNCSASSSSA